MAGGLFGGLSDAFFGSAPGFDYSGYLDMMGKMDAQVNELFANAPQSNILGGQAYTDIRSLLGPTGGMGGVGGLGLSPGLLAMYNAGSQRNALDASANGAMAQSGIQARNLGGSSIEQQALQAAQFQGGMANSSLLASLYGLQNQNTSQLAGMLGQGAQFDVSANNALLGMHANALMGMAGQYGSLAGQGMGMDYQGKLAGYQNAGNLGNSLIGAGATAGMLGGMGAFSGGAGAGGGSMFPMMAMMAA
jgi:hypothetical protein